MNIPLVIAGCLSLIAAAIHGGAGEVLVVRRLSPRLLPSTNFGGPAMTKAMIWVSWHIATIALLTVGVALVLSGSVLHTDAARVTGLIASAASTGIAALALAAAISLVPRSLSAFQRRLRLHPGPLILTAIPVLAWSGMA